LGKNIKNHVILKGKIDKLSATIAIALFLDSQLPWTHS